MDLNNVGTADTDSGSLKPKKVIPELQHPSFLQNLQHYFWEYCSHTSVHGLSYLGERRRTLLERIWWLIAILISLYFCIGFIADTYHKWVTSPVIVALANTQTPIWEIPFPAITICPEIKSMKERYNHTDLYIRKKNKQNLTEREAMEFEYMSLLCEPHNITLLNESLLTFDDRVIDFFVEVAGTFNDTVYEHYWRGSVYNLSELFFPVLTDDGLCYTFNGLDRSQLFTEDVRNYWDFFSTLGKSSNWSVESGYLDDLENESYPRRISTPGINGGLTLFFAIPRKQIDYTCGRIMPGFKVVIHSPTEVPHVKNKYFRVPLDSWVYAAIKPNMMTTSNSLRNYKPHDRQCYFVEERKLKYFKIYNQENCLSECLIDFTLKTCGCVGFYMQRTNSTPICGTIKHWKCMEEAKVNYLSSKVNNAEKRVSKYNKKCDCLPSCNSLSFDVELSQSEWHWEKFSEIERHVDEQNRYFEYGMNSLEIKEHYHLQRLTVFFKDMQFVSSERNELFGKTDFFSNCGGLLGLFTGFSFISALEILYYLTLRFICNLRKFGRHYWSGSEELLEQKKEL